MFMCFVQFLLPTFGVLFCPISSLLTAKTAPFACFLVVGKDVHFIVYLDGGKDIPCSIIDLVLGYIKLLWFNRP